MRSSNKDMQEDKKNIAKNNTISLNQLIINDYVQQQPYLRQHAENVKQPSEEEFAADLSQNESMLFTVHVMDKDKHPIKNRAAEDYVKQSKNPTLSFHQVDKVIKKNPKKKLNPIRFFKHNPRNSLMSELEAVCCAFFRLLAPRHAPSARAHYDKNNVYVGLSSKGIPGFKSTKEDPLRDQDLLIDILEKGYFTIPELDEIDTRALQDGYTLEKMADGQVLCEKFINRDNKNKKAFVTVKDLKNYRIVKGQAIGLTTSYLLGEDDCHRGNISRYGVRIDFDMILWWFLCHFKESGIVDWTFRFPNESTFAVTPYDILHFPNLKDADPFYWPTKPPKLLKEPLRSFVAKMLPISENAYETRDNTVFQKLETHPVFIYHKFATLLKFILTDAEMYRHLASLYIRENISVGDKNIIDLLSQHLANRINLFKKVLLQMPAFYKFLNTVDKEKSERYDDIILRDIKAEFEERNKKFMEKISKYPEYQSQVIPLDHIQNEYESFMSEAKEIHDNQQITQLEAEFSLMQVDSKSEPGQLDKKISKV